MQQPLDENAHPRLETIALISEERNISLDEVMFHDQAPQTVVKCLADYLTGKRAAESRKNIDPCMSIDKLK